MRKHRYKFVEADEVMKEGKVTEIKISRTTTCDGVSYVAMHWPDGGKKSFLALYPSGNVTFLAGKRTAFTTIDELRYLGGV